MYLRHTGLLTPGLLLLVWLALLSAAFADDTNGPTLHFDYGRGSALSNSVSKFMYFVPLVSPELISLYTNAGNSQFVRVISYNNHTKGKAFHAVCEFEFTGCGSLEDVFDNTPAIRKNDKELKAGKTLPHQIKSIGVNGTGSGSLDVDGMVSNGVPIPAWVEMHFNTRGHTSPVNIDLVDLTYSGGAIHYGNEMVARVNVLTFHQQCDDPHMEVTLDSLKRKDAPDSRWANFLGEVKGFAANAFLPPIRVTSEGNQTMMDFGQALAAQKPDFTFPFAERLKTNSISPLAEGINSNSL